MRLQGLSFTGKWRWVHCAALFAFCATFSSAAHAAVSVVINRPTQSINVLIDNSLVARWPVSTARRGYITPPGVYRARRLERIWYSSKYESSPMPYSIFFRGGYAIHGTYEIRRLGSPVSHGCVRLHTAHARKLFNLVRETGASAARIIVR